MGSNPTLTASQKHLTIVRCSCLEKVRSEPIVWLACGSRTPERCHADFAGRRDREAVARPRRRKPTRAAAESHPHRQVLHSAKLKDVASAQSASAWYFSAILKAFLKSHASVRSAMRKFEPIFFRKSRIRSGFSC